MIIIKNTEKSNSSQMITLQLYNRIIVVRSVFHEGGKFYP